jgi:hypothetical protein
MKHTTEFRPSAGVRSRPKEQWSIRKTRGSSRTASPLSARYQAQTRGFMQTLGRLAYTRMKQS